MPRAAIHTVSVSGDFGRSRMVRNFTIVNDATVNSYVSSHSNTMWTVMANECIARYFVLIKWMEAKHLFRK